MWNISTQWNQQPNRYVFSKQSTVWNKTFENKSIGKDHLILNKWTEYKIFELRYWNTKQLGNTKYNQLKIVLAVFASAYLYLVSIKLYQGIIY